MNTLRILAYVQTNIAYRKQNVARSQTDAQTKQPMEGKTLAKMDFSYNDRQRISYA